MSRNRSLKTGLANRRRRRALRRVRRLVELGSSLALLLGVVWLWRSPAWRFEGQLSVTGNRLISQAAILQRLNLKLGVPLYKLDPNQLAAQLEGLPAISDVAVHRWLFPARLEIAILERQPLLQVSSNLYLDPAGVLFEADPKLVKAKFPVQLQTTLQAGGTLDHATRDGLLNLLASWPRGLAGSIDLRNRNDVRVNLGVWPLRLGNFGNLPQKLSLLDELKPLAKKYQGKLDYIDLRFPTSPSFKLMSGSEISMLKKQATASAAIAVPKSPALPDKAATP